MLIDKKFLDRTNKREWINKNYWRLQGSALFTKNNNNSISKLISKFCAKDCPTSKLCNNFVPSHIAAIYEDVDENGEKDIYILDIKPPFSTRQKLIDYLKNTTDEYLIVVRYMVIDVNQYNDYTSERVHLKYGFLSAIQSVFKNFTLKHGMHCSESYIYSYNQQGYMYDINANKSTPDNLMHYLIDKQKEYEHRCI